MIILHVACISNNPFSGVSVVVPEHIFAQSEFAEVALLNVSGIEIEGVKKQLPYKKKYDITGCSAPFNKPDLVVFHECYRIEYISIAQNLKKNGIPYIIMPHGELRKEAQRKKRLKKIVANLLIFNKFIGNACAIQCLSEAEKQNTIKGKQKFVGTNGISSSWKVKQGFDSEQIKFIYIGRYEWKVKGIDLLLDAVKSKADFMRNNQCKVYMYGPDNKGRYAYVENMILERGIEDIVHLNHEIYGLEKEKELLSADIFIQTSRHEGMPCGILEALSYGLPCLVTKGTTLGELIEDSKAGWSAENTAESIAEKIEEAVKSKTEWESIGRAATDLVRDKFSWRTIAKETIESYKNMI